MTKKKLKVEKIAERVSELVKEFTDSVEAYQAAHLKNDMTPELPPLEEYDNDGMYGWCDDSDLEAVEEANSVMFGSGSFDHRVYADDGFIEMIDAPEPELDEEPGADEAPSDKVNALFHLTVTRTQLVHLRDLFSVLLSFDDDLSLSAALAKKEGRELAESRLWDKLHELCEEAGIPLDETAPDFVVGLSENPKLGLFTLEPDDLEEPEE